VASATGQSPRPGGARPSLADAPQVRQFDLTA
jgi:hypothetical protein